MFARMVYESFRRQKRRKLLAGIAVTLGVAVATAMVAVATDIGDKISRELRTFGANLIVTLKKTILICRSAVWIFALPVTALT
jgi:putative ABC transport system permease protein